MHFAADVNEAALRHRRRLARSHIVAVLSLIAKEAALIVLEGIADVYKVKVDKHCSRPYEEPGLSKRQGVSLGSKVCMQLPRTSRRARSDRR